MGGPARTGWAIHPYTDNFYETDIYYTDEYYLDGKVPCKFNSSEHLYQYFKCRTYDDHDDHIKSFILSSKNPQEAWENGQRVPLRDDWEDIKIGMMLKANCLKFQNKELLERLKSTEGRLVLDGSTKFWNYWNGVILEYIRDVGV